VLQLVSEVGAKCQEGHVILLENYSPGAVKGENRLSGIRVTLDELVTDVRVADFVGYVDEKKKRDEDGGDLNGKN